MKFMSETAESWSTALRMHSGITYGSIQLNQQKCPSEKEPGQGDSYKIISQNADNL